MSYELARRYARLLTEDTDACARLFADDAVFSTRRAGEPVELRGRAGIRAFIAKVPRHLSFRIVAHEDAGDATVVDVEISGEAFRTVDRWQVASAGDEITSLRVLQEGVER